MSATVRPAYLKEAAMKRTIWSVIVFSVVCLAVVPVAEADESERFSVRDVKGPTAFAFDGFVAVGQVMAPAAAVGRFIADGKGNITDGVRTLVVGGATPPLSATFTCTYTVDSDGTGAATCAVATTGVPGTTTESFDFVIVQKGKEAFFTSTTPRSTLRGETKRQQ
jgi:hypothetical protein